MSLSDIFYIEIGEEGKPSRCDCCDRESWTGHGFVYRNDDAFAVYYVGGSPHASYEGVTLALAIGEWGEEDGPSDRVCAGLKVWRDEHETRIAFLEPEESPWGETKLLGKMLPRHVAMEHPEREVFIAITNRIVEEHASVNEALSE